MNNFSIYPKSLRTHSIAYKENNLPKKNHLNKFKKSDLNIGTIPYSCKRIAFNGPYPIKKYKYFSANRKFSNHHSVISVHLKNESDKTSIFFLISLICCAYALSILLGQSMQIDEALTPSQKSIPDEAAQLHELIIRTKKTLETNAGNFKLFGKKELIDELLDLKTARTVKILGKGSHKRVFVLTPLGDTSKKTIAVTKICFESCNYQQDFRDKALINEFKIGSEIAQLNIPGIIPMGIIWHHSSSINEVLIVTKFCNGKDLRLMSKKMSNSDKLQCFKSIWSVIEKLHRSGFEHGDLHSGNILIHQSKKGHLKYYLTDFGCSEKIQKEKMQTLERYDQKSFGDLIIENFDNMGGSESTKLYELALRLRKVLKKPSEGISDAEISEALSKITVYLIA